MGAYHRPDIDDLCHFHCETLVEHIRELLRIIQTVTMGPWYILFIVKMVFTMSKDMDGSFTNSIFFTFAEYATCVLQCLGMLLSSVLTLVGLTVQYGHAADKIDGVGVVEKIEHFDELDNF